MKVAKFGGSSVADANQFIKVADIIKSDLPEETWTPFTHTREEHQILDTKGSDIQKYVEEMRDKFISGSEPLDNWEKYVEEIEKMGLDEYMDVQEAAYERYMEQ